MLTRLASVLATLAALAVLSGPAQAADGDPVDVNPIGGPGGIGGGARVEVGVGAPGSGGNAEPDPPRPPRDAGSPACTTNTGAAIECQDSIHGSWSPALNCYVRQLVPQPGKDDPVWNGRTDGAIYFCSPPPEANGVVGPGMMVWLPAGAAADLVDPAVLAARAVERMNLVGARVGATPLNGGEGVVGLQTWLWVANDGPTSMGPISRTATAGSVSVTATARVTQVDWDMGNGDRKRCTEAGTKWTRGYGAKDSPTCGYTYLRDSGDQPSDAYRITATTHWRVDWEGGGQTGTITFTLAGAPLSMTVVELQAPRIR